MSLYSSTAMPLQIDQVSPACDSLSCVCPVDAEARGVSPCRGCLLWMPLRQRPPCCSSSPACVPPCCCAMAMSVKRRYRLTTCWCHLPGRSDAVGTGARRLCSWTTRALLVMQLCQLVSQHVQLDAICLVLQSWLCSLHIKTQRILLELLVEAVCSLKTASQCVPCTR